MKRAVFTAAAAAVVIGLAGPASAFELVFDVTVEGVSDGELGIAWVGSGEMRALKLEHLGIDEVTDVLSFPLDGRDELPDGEPRALGDVVLCPEVVGERWREPMVHGLLHLLGYDHGEEMTARERVHGDR